MRRQIIALVLTLPSLGHATPLSQSETQDLVRRIQTINKSKPSIEANFSEERHTAILKEPVRNEGKVWAVPPDKIRREIGGKTPSATVIDGRKMVRILKLIIGNVLEFFVGSRVSSTSTRRRTTDFAIASACCEIWVVRAFSGEAETDDSLARPRIG